MSIRIPKPVIFALSFLLVLALYWPAMNGTPIWDDFTYWFKDPVMRPAFSYAEIWSRFAWPLSVSIQKLMYALFDQNYFLYHFTCLIIHFANSLLVYKLGRYMRFKYPLVLFFLFLLHPVCVITTAWMIQIKTLLCFFFALASMLAFMKGNKNIKWMYLSWFLFACSILSKTVSFTLPVILLAYSFKVYRFKKLHLLLPFFLCSGWSVYKVLVSPVTYEGSSKAASITKVKREEPVKVEEKKPEPAPEVKEAPKPKPKPKKPKKKPRPLKKPEPLNKPEPEAAPVVDPVKVLQINNTATESETKSSLKFFNFDVALISQTLHYYFWQIVLPSYNQPVKGLNYETPGFEQFLHLFFLLILLYVCWGDSALLFLGAAHFLLIPFLGFIPAPFMTITWVSDQHLYLVLPAILCFWMRLLDKIPWKHAYVIPVLFLFYFSYKTHETSKYYEDHFVFYEESLKYNPYNVPFIYNLAFERIVNGEWHLAYNILEDAYHLSQTEILMKKNFYYPYLMQLYVDMKSTLEKHESGN